MVCKEDVLAWFKDLESYRRIDVVYELLNMCVPFEVRFLGACVEEIGKHTYQELRGPAIVANDVDRLAKDASLLQGILDEHVRHRVLLYMSLLSARNCKCATWLYKNVFRTDWLEDYVVKGNCKEDSNVQSELLLLFTMGLHHPAFAFEEKLFFGRMLSLLMEHRENRVPIKPTVFYSSHPPGISVYPTQKITNVPDVPVKVALPMPMVDNTTVIHHGHPPGLSALPVPSPSIELLWSRPAFAGTVCGAPEVPPFPPPPPISPMVSQAGSPIQSRSTSPHRTSMRPPPPPPPLLPTPVQALETLPTQLPMDPLSLSNRPLFNSDAKLSDDEVNHGTQDDKLREASWATAIPLPLDTKPINGIRFPAYNKPPVQQQQQQPQQTFIVDQMQALNLDGENNPPSSGSSSPAETPTTPHGPGRGLAGGDSKQPRMNGVPPFQQPPLCDATPPPPSLPPMVNCSVPYSYPAHAPLPNRSLFQYAQQAYRAPFTATPAHPYPYQPADTVYTSLTVPYHLSYMYSSSGNNQQAAPPPRNSPNCYNCGASGHTGTDCTGQTIEDITQKKTYQLEYASPLPDVDQ